MKHVKVKHKKSGIIYLLVEREDGSWRLSSNDGFPSGQVLNDPLERILKDFNLEVVEE